jgi:prepilin-type N-terminal cleavage/methylation domain-containing protein
MDGATMMIFIRKTQGFSLFEVLLVLVVGAILTLSAIRYAKHQQEVAADQAYGQKLYTYGQAVNQYISAATSLESNCQLPGPGGNPSVKITGCTPGGKGNVTLTATGVSWLYPQNAGNNSTGVPFLPSGFSFAAGLSPLQMATVNSDGSIGATTGDNAIVTTVTFTQGNLPGPITITVQAGGLFENKGLDSKGKPVSPVFMPALTQEAITHANTLYSASLGGAAVNYTFPYIQAGGAAKPTNVSGSVSQSGLTYLQVKGSNTGGNSMLGTVNFDPAAGVNAAMTGVNQINFVPYMGQRSNINNLSQLSFLSSLRGTKGSIGSLTVLNFSQLGSGVVQGVVNNIQTINFDTKNATPNNMITGVDSIVFRQPNTAFFQGFLLNFVTMKLLVPIVIVKQGWNSGAWDTGVAANANGGVGTLCYPSNIISQVEADVGISGSQGWAYSFSGCTVSTDPRTATANGHWWIINSRGTFNSACSAACLSWSY